MAGQGRGQDLMVIPLMWDADGRVRALPLSEHTILLLQHWPRAHKHPSSFPGGESHFLLIPVISCSLRQALFDPKRELGKDFNLQIALFYPERFTFLGSADPCCAPGPLGVEVYVYLRTYPLSTTLVLCTPNQEGKKRNVLQQARPRPAFPFHNESTAVFSALNITKAESAGSPSGRHPPSPCCQSQQSHEENHTILNICGCFLLPGQGTCSGEMLKASVLTGREQAELAGLVLGDQWKEAQFLFPVGAQIQPAHYTDKTSETRNAWTRSRSPSSS